MKTQKDILKEAKMNHKAALKNKSLYKQKRDEILYAILQSPTPKWGAIRVIVTPL